MIVTRTCGPHTILTNTIFFVCFFLRNLFLADRPLKFSEDPLMPLLTNFDKEHGSKTFKFWLKLFKAGLNNELVDLHKKGFQKGRIN